MDNIPNTVTAKLPWLPGLSALMAFIACKGAILLIALFPLVGFTLSIDSRLQAATISIFALLTPLLVLCNYSRLHTGRAPVVLSTVAALMVAGTMYIHFNVIVESIGLVLLFISALWSWVAAKQPTKTAQPV